MRILVLLLLSLPATLIAFGETRFTGVVRDSAGTPIANAMVLIHWDSAGSTVGVTDNIVIKEDLVTRTDAVGTFSLELPPGFYDVFATAPAFTPTCRKVRIQAGKVEEIKFRMDAEPLYTAEMGNRVDALPPDSHLAPISNFVPPSYPPLARQAGISGQATITLEVNREGVSYSDSRGIVNTPDVCARSPAMRRKMVLCAGQSAAAAVRHFLFWLHWRTC